MKKKLYFSGCSVIVLAFFLAGCGGGGSSNNTPASSGNKLGVTAISNTNATGKPGFARNFIEKGISILFNQNIANAAGDLCGSPSSPIVADIPGGSIEIDEAIVILDGVEVDQVGTAANDIEVGPFVLDLLDNLADAGETISLDLPDGTYDKLKTDFKRIDDNPIATNTNVTAIKGKLLDETTKRRPSVWVKGFLSDGTTCTAFTFVTDERWKVERRFPTPLTLTSSNSLNLVVVFRLVDALKAVVTDTAKFNQLVAEIGANTPDFMGNEFLDGRTKRAEHGTLLAEAWGQKIPSNMDVFSQTVSVDNSPDGTSLVDDSATKISDSTPIVTPEGV